MTLTVALFDLDNTLYPISSGLMHMVDTRINEFVQEQLGVSPDEAVRIRREYFAKYGTTLRGLQQHHEHIDPEHYLSYVHDIALESYLASDAELDHLLHELPLRKIIFTNSPAEHARRVLSVIGIEHHFERVFDIRSFNFLAKPAPEAYEHVLRELGVQGRDCVMLEDTLANLRPARQLGMTTILIGNTRVLRGKHVPANYVVPDVLSAVRTALRIVHTYAAA